MACNPIGTSSAPITATSTTLGTSGTGQFTCLTGLVAPAPLTSQFLVGSHVLADLSGTILTSLRSDTVNLTLLEGQLVTLCGLFQVLISTVHGRQPLLTVTAALNPNVLSQLGFRI